MLCCVLWLCWNDEWLSELCVHPLVISESATNSFLEPLNDECQPHQLPLMDCKSY